MTEQEAGCALISMPQGPIFAPQVRRRNVRLGYYTCSDIQPWKNGGTEVIALNSSKMLEVCPVNIPLVVSYS